MRSLVRALIATVCVMSIAACSRNRSLAVVTPDAEGRVGAVALYPVHGEGAPVVLNQPYGAAEIDAAGRTKPVAMDKEQVQRLFGPTLAAMPPRPSRFILYFREGSEQLTDASLGVTKAIAADIAARPAAEVVVIGHTDTVGDDAVNDQLSLQRASTVKKYLIQHGIPADRIAVSGRGKRELMVPTGDSVNEPNNRRVEINVR